VFGTFDEKALAAYTEKVRQKRVEGKQGTEWADNAGVGEHDHSALGNADDFAEYDFAACLREEPWP